MLNSKRRKVAKCPLAQQNPKSGVFKERFLKNKVTFSSQMTFYLLEPLCSCSRDQASDDTASKISNFSVEVSN